MLRTSETLSLTEPLLKYCRFGSVGRSGHQGLNRGGLRPVTVFFQRLGPARGILAHPDRWVINPRVAIRFAAGEQNEDRADHFMGHGDDGLLVAFAGYQAWVLVGQGAVGSPGGIGDFAHQVADGVVALTGLTGLALAGTLGLPGLEERPRRRSGRRRRTR
jgi:hypothetical protein